MKQMIEKKPVVWVGFLLGVFTFVAFSFSFQQNLWVDESTQMSGLSLPLIDIYQWLSGLIDNPFPVPSDRMPMLSYLLGFVWSRVFGLEILTMRWLSLVLVLSALIILSVYFLRRKQYGVLLASLSFLCLSPNLIIYAVEIRAYSLFFFFSLVALVIYLTIIDRSERSLAVGKHILALALVLSLAINTHFFGVVLAGAMIATYLLTSFFDARVVMKWKYLWWVSVILLIALLGIVLPVLASFTTQAGSQSSDPLIRSAVKLIYRLVVHQAMGEVAIAPYVALLVVYGVIAYSVIRRLSLLKVSLVLMLVLGFGAVLTANIVLSNFDALAPHYNLWMLIVLAVLFGVSVAELPTRFAGLAIVTVSLCLAVGQYHLAASGKKYAHTRLDQIQARLDIYRGANIGVLYNKSMAKTWFAGRYLFADEVSQYIVSEAGYNDLANDRTIKPSEIAGRHDILIVVYGENIYSHELVESPAEVVLPEKSPVYQQASFLGEGWEKVEGAKYMAQESAEILVYKKTP